MFLIQIFQATAFIGTMVPVIVIFQCLSNLYNSSQILAAIASPVIAVKIWKSGFEAVVDLLVVYQIFEQQMLINIVSLVETNRLLKFRRKY